MPHVNCFVLGSPPSTTFASNVAAKVPMATGAKYVVTYLCSCGGTSRREGCTSIGNVSSVAPPSTFGVSVKSTEHGTLDALEILNLADTPPERAASDAGAAAASSSSPSPDASGTISAITGPNEKVLSPREKAKPSCATNGSSAGTILCSSKIAATSSQTMPGMQLSPEISYGIPRG